MIPSTFRYSGFSLLEVMVVMAIIMTVIFSVVSIHNRFLVDLQLDAKTDELVGMLRLSHARSSAKNRDSSWGVHFVQDISGGVNSFTLFKGATYASRDASFDVVTPLPVGFYFPTISLSGGGSDVIFQKGTGKTSQYGFVDLRDLNANVHRIAIGPRGVIEKL